MFPIGTLFPTSFDIQHDPESECGIMYVDNTVFGIQIEDTHYLLQDEGWHALAKGGSSIPVNEQAIHELNYILNSLIDLLNNHTN